MAQIVAAEFKEFAQAESVVEALQEQGFASSQLTTFYLNAPGQHAKLAMGGDRYEDPAAAAAGPGALKGAALGSVAGLALGAAAAPVQRPAGVVVAVLAPTPAERERAASILWRHRAHSIEIAEGVWKHGTWQDFDPVSIPKWRKAPGT
jgi:hypothetical protein